MTGTTKKTFSEENGLDPPCLLLSPFCLCVYVQWIFETFEHGEFLPNYKLLKVMAKYVCSENMSAIEGLCENLIFLITGFDNHNNFNLVSWSVCE